MINIYVNEDVAWNSLRVLDMMLIVACGISCHTHCSPPVTSCGRMREYGAWRLGSFHVEKMRVEGE